MSQSVSVNKELNVVEVRSSGAVTEEDVIKSIGQICHMRKEYGLDRLLVDSRKVSSPISILAAHRAVEDAKHQGVRTAVLVTSGSKAEELNQFVETVAHNRSFPLKVFYKRGEAIEWLNR